MSLYVVALGVRGFYQQVTFKESPIPLAHQTLLSAYMGIYFDFTNNRVLTIVADFNSRRQKNSAQNIILRKSQFSQIVIGACVKLGLSDFDSPLPIHFNRYGTSPKDYAKILLNFSIQRHGTYTYNSTIFPIS